MNWRKITTEIALLERQIRKQPPQAQMLERRRELFSRIKSLKAAAAELEHTLKHRIPELERMKNEQNE